MLNTIERRTEILNLLAAKGKVLVDELADNFQISTVTIRNDLNLLHKKGLLVRSHGGAIITNRITQELSIVQKQDENSSKKRAIGKYAAQFIHSDSSIIMDSGSTTEEIVRNISERSGLIVMTNGLNIAHELAGIESVEVMMTGGTLRKKSASFYGRLAEESLKKLRFKTLFLGVDGFDKQMGITTYFEPEASLNRVMCEVASEIIVVSDSSKFGRNSVHVVTDLSHIDKVITDENISDSLAAELERCNVELHIVDNKHR